MAGGHTVIIGGGIIGVCSAYYLAKRGHRVTLIDRGEIGSGASFGSAGIIAIGHPPMPRPGLVGQALRWMFKSDSPLYVPPRMDPSLISWLWRFYRSCSRKHESHCMEFLAQLGVQASECFETLIQHEKLNCEFRSTGWFDVFRSEEAMQHGEHDAKLLRSYGYEADVLPAEELRKREPMLKSGISGAVHYSQSAIAEPYQFLVQLADRAQAHGAEVRQNTPIRSFIVENGKCKGVHTQDGVAIEADSVVLAAGSWTTQLARLLGINVPMQPGKGYHRNITPPEVSLNTACVLGERHIAVTPMGGYLRLSGTVELSGMNHRLVSKRLNMLSAGASVFLEGIDEAQTISEWCGLRPCTADGLPIVGWAPNIKGVFIATGHARMGFTLGPVTGKLVSECILDDEPSIDLSPLRVERFAQRRRPIAAGL